MTKKKIHYHTDNAYFAGCENMLPNFWAAEELREVYTVTFSYRASPAYTQGLNHRAQIDFPIYPLAYPDPSNVVPLPDRLASSQQKALQFVQRAIFKLPLLLYESFVLAKLLKRLAARHSTHQQRRVSWLCVALPQ